MSLEKFKSVITTNPTWSIKGIPNLKTITFYQSPMQALVITYNTGDPQQTFYKLSMVGNDIELSYEQEKFVVTNFNTHLIILTNSIGEMKLEIDLNSIEDKICHAIKNKLVIEFKYQGFKREVAPFTLGKLIQNGELGLSAYRKGGITKSEDKPDWREYIVSEIKSLKLTDNTFKEEKGYNPNNSRMSKINCTAKF